MEKSFLKIFLLVVCAVEILQACGKSKTKRIGNYFAVKISWGNFNFIPGPKPSITIDKIPFQVSVQKLDKHICSGSIISPLLVITAASCCDTLANFLSVRSGSNYHDRNGTVTRVAHYHFHPNFDKKTKEFDASILWLTNKIVFNDFQQPIDIEVPEREFGEKVAVESYGWGLGKDANMILRATKFRLLNRMECGQISKDRSVNRKTLCVVGTREGDCNGGERVV